MNRLVSDIIQTLVVKVRKALGVPSFSGEVSGIGLMAIDFSFDRYESDANYIHFEYINNDSKTRLVTIGNA